MKVEKIDHIAIRVRNLEEAKTFFGNLLETRFIDFGEFPELDIRSAIEPSLGMELVEPLTPSGPLAREIDRKGEGLTLLSLKVSNLEQAVAKMKSAGIRLINRIERGSIKAAIFHPKDTYGVVIEFVV